MLGRQNSKTTLRGHEDMQRCLEQKNAMVQSLQSEVEQLRVNQERYDRVRDQLNRLRQRYDRLVQEYNSINERQTEKVELGVKNINELKTQIEHLQTEINERVQAQRDQKFETQLLLERNQQKDQELNQVKVKIQEQKNNTEVLKMEQDRLKVQIALLKEELEKQRKDLSAVKKNSDNVSDKIYKTQNYLRNLTREELSSNDQLGRLEDDNNYLDQCLEQMQVVIIRNNEEGSIIQKDIQNTNYDNSTKELDRKKVEKDNRQKQRVTQIQKDKTKVLSGQIDQRKNQLNRMTTHQNESMEGVSEFIRNNSEIGDINQQLKEDLSVCTKHLQNLVRSNKFLEEQLGRLQEVNNNIILRLQNPNQSKDSTINRNFGKTSRLTTYGLQN